MQTNTLSTEQKLKISSVLQQHKPFMASFALIMSDRKIRLSTYESEKWNFDESPSVDGKFDVEGHAGVDVNGYYNPGIMSRIKMFFSSLKDFWELTSILPWYTRYTPVGNKLVKKRTLNVKPYFAWGMIVSPFKQYYGSWVWVINSIDIAASDMAEEDFYKKNGFYALKKGDIMDVTHMAKSYTRAEIYTRLESDGEIQIAPGIFANPTDPTVLIIDQLKYPFDLKDGWSTLKSFELLRTVIATYSELFKLPAEISATKKEVLRFPIEVIDGEL